MRNHRTHRTRSTQILHGLYLAVVAGVGTLVGPAIAAPAVAAPVCRTPPEPRPVIRDLPWAQRWFEPHRIWAITRGQRAVVAVVDSGVDATHPQLRDGRVRTGHDLVTNTPGGNVDCDSHGTAIASIIAGSTVDGVGFAGLAPRAEILPIRVAESGAAPAGDDPALGPAALATALRLAADQGARVINVSVVFYVDHPDVAAAVRYAQGRNAVIVAAVGNHHDDERPVDPPTYPAAYPDVVGVGALALDGTRATESYVGPYVDLLAPGVDVIAATTGGGHAAWTGASMATAFVSAAAALLVSANDRLSAQEIARQLLATADPPAGSRSGYGRGVVNPYRALTERAADGQPVVIQPPAEHSVDPLAVERERRWRDAARLAALVAAGALGLAILALAARAVHRRGRDTGWSPERHRTTPPAPPLDDEPERLFFTVPVPPHRR
jgi:type VII secretion-associated serine protease mycosin